MIIKRLLLIQSYYVYRMELRTNLKISANVLHLILGIVMLLPYLSSAQSNRLLDSLLSGYNTATTDSQKYAYASELFWEHIYREPDTGFKYAALAFDAAERMGDQEKKARSLNFWGIYYRDIGAYFLADSVLNMSVEIQTGIGDTIGLSRSYGNLANLYDARGLYEETIEMNLKALELYEMLKDTIGVGICLNNIGRVHYVMKQYEQAGSFYHQALEISSSQNDSLGMAQNLGNIGIVEKQLERYEDALDYYKRSLDIFQRINQPRSVAYNLMNIGLLYRELKDFTQAESYMMQALDSLKDIGSPRAIALLYDNLGKNYLLQDQYDKALSYGQQAESMSLDLGARYELRNAYQTLHKAYAGLGNLKQAYEYQQKYVLLNDSLINESNTEKIQELEARYENERKEKAIAQLNEEAAVQDATILKQKAVIRTRNAIIVGVLMALAIAAFATNNYRQKQQLARQEKEIEYQKRMELQNQQKLLMMDAMIEGQENERIRVAKDLHDGVGSLLAALKIRIGTIGTQETKDDSYQNVYQLAGNAYEEVRRVAHNMMPLVLINQGLISALKQLVSNVKESSHLDIHWQMLGAAPRLQPNEELMLYRIVQELLNNVVKHAEATEVIVQMSEDEHHHVLMVEDNGRGFDPGINKDGMGLENIRSRIEYLGADVDIDSQIGEGTTIILYIPKV